MLGCGSAMLPHFLQEKQMKISNNGLDLIKHFEGLVLKAYKCPAGVWTIGYGHTKDVQPGDEWSESNADHMLEVEMEEYEGYIHDSVTAPINQDQFDALVSWVYNLGGGNLKASTMLKVLNAGQYEEVPAQMMRWNKAGGKVLEGLTRRRQAEANLFMGKEWKE
tara:strand:+ start:1809 stop:2300 length:492 start_codon:yes stop_codon:yes gene_type:complete